jgi:pimeloyl-ACP methyl ester carboxylesterase
MPYRKANGITIYYEEYGKGEPLVLINGLSFILDLWFAQIEELSKRFRVIALDNRGIGGSDAPDEEYSIRMMADDTADLLRGLGIVKTHVAGLSMGGYIAQEMALSHPSLVDRLVLIATCMGGPRSTALGKPFWDKLALELVGLTPEEMCRKDLTLMSAPGFAKHHPEIIEQAAALRTKKVQPMHAFIRQYNACMAFDINHRAPDIKQPTLIIMGREDLVFPLALAEDFREKMPRAEIVVYEDCGHAILLEKADLLNRDLLRFLTAGS